VSSGKKKRRRWMMEKKFAILRLTADGEDRLIIVPVVLSTELSSNCSKIITLSAARRQVMKQFENGTAAWVGWVDRYTLFDTVKPV
jgi:hypothetical protein